MTGPSPVPGRRRRLVAKALIGLALFLAAESFFAPAFQPTAWLLRGGVGAWRWAISPAAKALGVRCRYSPTCSEYAAGTLERSGTLRGLALITGRLWRCSPWGGGPDASF